MAPDQAARRLFALARAADAGRLIGELRAGDRVLARLDPAPSAVVLAPSGAVQADGGWRPHVVVRPADDGWIVEAPDSRAPIWLCDRALAAVAGRGPAGLVSEVRRLACAIGVWGVPDDSEASVWSSADAWFEAAGRRPRPHRPRGGTWRHRERQPPDIRAPWPGSTLKLPPVRPSQASLADALLTRRSVRKWSDGAPDIGALSDLLGQVMARVEGRRSWPSGGGAYPLEVYLAHRDCDGIEPGLHHYSADAHALTMVRPFDDQVRALLGQAAPEQDPPPVVLVIAARFLRTLAKYEGIGLRLVLLEAGTLLQNFQLVAPSLRLGACVVGGGSCELFGRCTGLSPWTEGSVVELAVGCE